MAAPRSFVHMVMIGLLSGLAPDQASNEIQRSAAVEVLWNVEAGG